MLDQNDKPVVAVESKWVGATAPSVERIFWDLIRLEMLANLGFRCFFLIGGRRKDLEDLFAHPAFDAWDNRGQGAALLRHDNNVQHTTTLGPTVNVRTPLLRALFAGYQAQEFPHAILSLRSAPFPKSSTSSAFQIYVWEIKTHPKRQVFRPENSARYRQPSSVVGHGP